MTTLKTLTLNDGNKVPVIAFGTGTAQAFKDSSAIVKEALDAGLTHLDCAWWYKNQEYTSKAIRENGMPRDKLFITSKVGDFHGDPEAFDAEVFLTKTLEDLGVDYVDLYLLHADILVQSDVTIAWRQMEEIKRSGRARSIGLSNFSTKSIQAILESCEIKPTVNQVEFHPYAFAHYLPTLLPLCQKHDIKLGGYTPLMSLVRRKGGPVDQAVREVGSKRDRGETEAQILLLWAQQVAGGIVVTTTSKPERMTEQIELFKEDSGKPPLSQTHLDLITSAGTSQPFRWAGAGWPYFMQGEGGFQCCPPGSTHLKRLDDPTAHLRTAHDYSGDKAE